MHSTARQHHTCEGFSFSKQQAVRSKHDRGLVCVSSMELSLFTYFSVFLKIGIRWTSYTSEGDGHYNVVQNFLSLHL